MNKNNNLSITNVSDTRQQYLVSQKKVNSADDPALTADKLLQCRMHIIELANQFDAEIGHLTGALSNRFTEEALRFLEALDQVEAVNQLPASVAFDRRGALKR